jgi:phage/plasmid-associated DNA primase
MDDPLARTPREKLYTAYQKWCVRKGHEYPLSPSSFGVELRAVVPKLGDVHATIEGKRVRYYTGIAVKE